MFKHLGRRAKFFLVKEENKETSLHNEARIIPQVVPSSLEQFTPNTRREHMNQWARLSQKEKAA